MRHYVLLLLAGLFLDVLSGCSGEKKKSAEISSETVPPPPVSKGKPLPSKAEK
jgi:hypothetical protein